MACAEQDLETFGYIKMSIDIGVGSMALALLNTRPDIKSTSIIPGTNETLRDYVVNHYKDKNADTPKDIFLDDLQKHDLGEQVAVDPVAENAAKQVQQNFEREGGCKQTMETPTTAPQTPKIRFANLSQYLK